MPPTLRRAALHWLTSLLVAFGLLTSLRANVPGGGEGGADVTLTDHGTTVVLANGIVSATISKAEARVTSLVYHGNQMVDPKGLYWSMDGGKAYQNPVHCAWRVVTQTPAMVDVSCKHVYAKGDPHAVDIDIHYVLRQGNTGLYAYAVLEHQPTHPALTLGEWRMVCPVARDPVHTGNWLLEKICVDKARHWQAPSPDDLQQATTQGIKEIVLLNTGVRKGQYECKYEYACEYYKVGTYGWASDVHHIGQWVVLGNYEYFNDGPPQIELGANSNGGGLLLHFGRDHYGGSVTSIAANQAWSKIYGPFLIYFNSSAAGADACWADAQAQVAAEHSAWPYTWLTANSHYPPAAARGTVTGKLIVSDVLKPSQTSAGAWVGVADTPAGTNWQSWSNGYEYWAQADPNGNFTLPNVRPGTYTLSAYVTGEVGEYTQTNVQVTAGETTALGNTTWVVAHPGRSIAWEIGIPDRSAEEFADAANHWVPYNYHTLHEKFPNPVEYTIGSSVASRDFPYVHSALWQSDGKTVAWPWNLHFNLSSVPGSGDATLVVAIASSISARLQVTVNGTPLESQVAPVEGGNSLLREGVHAKYCTMRFTIPVSNLKVGANTLQLLQTKTKGEQAHIMYDYLRLEMP
ncbi:MAG: polysaccharide lyase family 4 protein [Chthoniobacter sp.]|nr:polysaccharide lyase family 4 protein [Chthoniobacter sp.]